jgi:transposase-like protein
MRKNTKYAATSPNVQCEFYGTRDQGNVAPHGFSKVKWGRGRRYRCTTCGKTFGATTGTPYKRLLCPMRQFDLVVALSMEGVGKAAIARLEDTS